MNTVKLNYYCYLNSVSQLMWEILIVVKKVVIQFVILYTSVSCEQLRRYEISIKNVSRFYNGALRQKEI